MACNAMIQYLDSQNPDSRPLTLTPLAIEDITGEPVYSLTPTGRAEIIEHEPTITVKGLLAKRLAEFRAARLAREKARGKELLPAMEREEQAAILLAWTLENEVFEEPGQCS